MNQLLANIGLSDGQGNTSSMRVVMYLIVMAILIPAVVVACKTGQPLALTEQQLELLGMIFATKLYQNHQENGSTGNPLPLPPVLTPPKAP